MNEIRVVDLDFRQKCPNFDRVELFYLRRGSPGRELIRSDSVRKDIQNAKFLNRNSNLHVL